MAEKATSCFHIFYLILQIHKKSSVCRFNVSGSRIIKWDYNLQWYINEYIYFEPVTPLMTLSAFACCQSEAVYLLLHYNTINVKSVCLFVNESIPLPNDWFFCIWFLKRLYFNLCICLLPAVKHVWEGDWLQPAAGGRDERAGRQEGECCSLGGPDYRNHPVVRHRYTHITTYTLVCSNFLNCS